MSSGTTGLKQKNLWPRIGGLVLLCASWQADGQTTTTSYPQMAPLEQYLMQQDAEISLARSAAPEAISHDADVLILGSHGYEKAVKGKNGFVCLVLRSWTASTGDPDFWNPKLRGPACFNGPGARSYLTIVSRKTELVLTGMSAERMLESIKTGYARKELPTMEPGSMCFMLSREQYLGDAAGRWRPHLMFFLPQTSGMTWGAGVPGSPIIEGQDPEDNLTVFMIPVGKWSDGTAEHPADHPAEHSGTH